ncbi:hypothetical protein ABK040_015124 [Willaertia magna]
MRKLYFENEGVSMFSDLEIVCEEDDDCNTFHPSENQISELYNKLKNKFKRKIVKSFSGKFEFVKTNRDVLSIPYDLKVDNSTKTIYVADRGNREVRLFDKETLQVKSSFKLKSNPRGIAFDPSNENVVFVSCGDDEEHCVLKLNKYTGQEICKFENEFYTPTCMVIDEKTNRLYICEELNRKITVVSSVDGSYLFNFGLHDFSNPCGIEFTIDDEIVISDFNGSELRFYSKDGTFLRSSTHTLNSALGMKVDRQNGDIYCCESWGNKITILDKEGNFKRSYGRGDSDHKFSRPYGIDIDDEGLMYVTEKSGECISIFK